MAGRLLAALILLFSLSGPVFAETGSFLSDAQPSWKQLNAQQRTALAPLAREWNRMSDASREKWLGIAQRFARMSDIEQARMQDRMRDWVLLTPAQRDLARIQYKQLHTGSSDQQKLLEEKWREYSALPEEEKQRLRGGGRPVVKAPAPTPVPAASAPAGTPAPARPPKALTLKGAPTRPAPVAVISAPPPAEEPEEPDDSDF
ncbi:DUF3106 domain-containing protein [Uliginosibacterium paludis]|jgi:hypothetical protein|uniref:DUF3106 domain-containing protein n=1 Tax=Uliginosibacterium paludis TaxID=1615952 RepID=A0ABV2CMH1_9RHOO